MDDKDYQLAIRIKLGDQQAFELLFHKFYLRLCIFTNKFLNNPEEAKEVAQDVFVKIWEGRSNINPEDSLKSYLFKIAQNISLNKLQREKVKIKYAEILKLVYFEQQEISSHESLVGRELEGHIAKSIQNLPSECRKVFELSRNDGLKYREIAEALKISIKTVEAQMSKALGSLRVELRDYLFIIFITLISNNI